jgi:RES domain-containing protein
LRFRGTCFRAHEPRWSSTPLSGKGAAIFGARFNPKGVAALYLSLEPITALREINQSFPFKMEPCVLCSYEVDCEDVLDLRSEAGRKKHEFPYEAMSCAWFSDLSQRREPASWSHVRRLIDSGAAGILVPSFARRATASDQNLVLWRWSDQPPHKVSVFDPSGKLPRDQKSWG